MVCATNSILKVEFYLRISVFSSAYVVISPYKTESPMWRWLHPLKPDFLVLNQFIYRHGTHVFVNWLKLDPLFMIFGHFCNNKEEIKNMGDSTSLR